MLQFGSVEIVDFIAEHLLLVLDLLVLYKETRREKKRLENRSYRRSMGEDFSPPFQRGAAIFDRTHSRRPKLEYCIVDASRFGYLQRQSIKENHQSWILTFFGWQNELFHDFGVTKLHGSFAQLLDLVPQSFRRHWQFIFRRMRFD